MPPASLALLLLPLLRCLHFPVSGPYPQSPFSLLTLCLHSFQSHCSLLFPHSFGPRHPRAVPAPSLSRGGDPAATIVAAATCHPVHAAPRDPQTSDSPVHGEPFEPHPVHASVPSSPSLQVRRHPTVPSTTPAKAPMHASSHRTPKSPEKRPPRLKSFLEKTLTARETPNSPPPKAARSQAPHHSGSASSSLVLWETVGVTVFRSKRCPAARGCEYADKPPPDRAESCTPGRYDRR